MLYSIEDLDVFVSDHIYVTAAKRLAAQVT